MSLQQQLTIGKLYGGTFYDLTTEFPSISLLFYENKIFQGTFIGINDLNSAAPLQRVPGASATGTNLDLYDIIQVFDRDGVLRYTGQITEPITQIGMDGSTLQIKTLAYPAVGLNRTRVNNVYGTFNYQPSLRQIMVAGNETSGAYFPYSPHEYYTETATCDPSPGLTGSSAYDWRYDIYPVGGGGGTLVAKVASDGSYTPKTGTYFIKMSDSTGHTFNARFGALTGASPVGFPLYIENESNPQYDPTTGIWSKIPYLDFWIYRYHTAGTFNVELQLRINDTDYIRIQLTAQDHAGDDIDLIPEDGNWHHLQIPVGSKWGEGQILYDGANHKLDVSSVDTVISTRVGWDTQHATDESGGALQGNGGSAWNGIMDINFYVTAGLSPPSTMTVGLDSFVIGNLNAGNITVKDFVTGGPSPYAIDFDYVGNILDGSNNPNVLPYVNAIYEQATKTIMDICNLLAAVRYTHDGDHLPGVHWIALPYTASGLPKAHLVIAPVGDHNINGVDSSHKPETLWPTNTQYTASNPLIISNDIIASNFSKKEAEANSIIMNAVFQDPFMNEWCQEPFTKHSTGYYTSAHWTYYSLAGGTPVDDPITLTGDCINGPYGIGIPRVSGAADIGTPTATERLILTIPDLIDLNLISNSAISFWLKTKNLQTFEVRVYTDLYDVDANFSDGYGNYFWQQITPIGTGDPNDGTWRKIDLPLNNSKWGITNHATWSKPILAVMFRIVGGLLAGEYCYIDGLNINGVHIRGAYSPTAITAMGGLKEALINEAIYAGSKLAIGTIDQLDNLLIQETLRNTTTPWTGHISIPIDLTLLPGQMAWAINPTFGASAKQFRILWLQHDSPPPPTEATTTLYLTDDLTNSYARDPSEAQTAAIKAVNPDFQNRTFARLAAAGIPPKSARSKVVDVDGL